MTKLALKALTTLNSLTFWLYQLFTVIYDPEITVICIKLTNQECSFELTVTRTHTHMLSHPLGSSGECTLTVKRKLADWTGNFLFDSACLFSWTWLTCVDLSLQALQSTARALPCTHSQTKFTTLLYKTQMKANCNFFMALSGNVCTQINW